MAEGRGGRESELLGPLGVDDCVNDALSLSLFLSLALHPLSLLSLSLYLARSLARSLPRLKNKVRLGVELTANAEEL